MSDWWSTREPREQVLILVAAALSVLVVGFYGIAQPLGRSHAAASLRLDAARQDFATVTSGLQTARTAAAVTTGPAASADQFRRDATQLAQNRGLSVSRLQTSSDETVIVTMESVDPQLVFQWLRALDSRPGGQVVSATLNGREEGKVQAIIELRATSQ